MGTLMQNTPVQTLFVSVRRDELRRLKEESDKQMQQDAQWSRQLEQGKNSEKSLIS